ncbi:response regulator transcription factor [Verrucomicrobiota bacterium sgz303538]
MKVLIAEDDPITLASLSACIQAEGLTPICASHGREALELWEAHRPALLCLDIMMPEVDGFEVCRQVRSKDRAIPILFLSAKNEEVDVVVGLELGADDFIRKPFTRAEVMARIRAALRRARAATPPSRVLKMNDLMVWPDELRAERNGRAIELSPREAAMMVLLHENSGRPVSRDTFLDRCWDADYFPDSRTLDQHIAMLRKKVEADPANPHVIETVRGIGYRFRTRVEERGS